MNVKNKQLSPELYDVIDSPVVTEKSQMMLESNKVVFNVAPHVDKIHVKKAVESIFSVQVKDVNIAVRKGKKKRFRGIGGKSKDIKRAIVTLAEGQEIDISFQAKL